MQYHSRSKTRFLAKKCADGGGFRVPTPKRGDEPLVGIAIEGFQVPTGPRLVMIRNGKSAIIMQ